MEPIPGLAELHPQGELKRANGGTECPHSYKKGWYRVVFYTPPLSRSGAEFLFSPEYHTWRYEICTSTMV